MPQQMKTRLFLKILCAGILACTCATAHAADDDYQRATDDTDNVKEKLFTKKGRVELSLPDMGFVLNQSFITTYLLHVGATYYTSEEIGYNLEFSYGYNKNASERECLENFYNDPNDNVSAECGNGGDLPDDGKEANYGPAYMPIREINYVLAGNLVWNPVYGKQLLALRATSYFDVFITMGGGVVMSTYYPESTKLRNGKNSRADYIEDANNPANNSLDGGASKSETDQYGEAGRPDSQSVTSPFINLGIGQKYHFWKRYSIKFEFRNMTLLGTPGGFENLFAIWTGLGIRF